MLDRIVVILWIGFAVFSILSILLFMGKGLGLIAGFNTASSEEQDKYNKKEMSIVTGSGMALLAICQLFMAIFATKLPFYVFYIFQGLLIFDCIAIVILLNTVCKK